MAKSYKSKAVKVKSGITRRSDAEIDLIAALLLRFPQPSLPTRHAFAGGMYRREMAIPKGCLLVGEIHRKEHFFEVTAGRIAVFDDANGWQVLTAPFAGVSKPGVRRVGYALESARCVTMERTDKRTVKAAEKELLEPRKIKAMSDKNFELFCQCETNSTLKLLPE
jgi:hypothetical protein